MKSFVRVKVVVPGTHHWPGAPSRTAFLRHPHRHLFRFEVDVAVTHSDRDVEFFDFQHQLRNAIHEKWPCDSMRTYEFGAQSCEMLAQWVMDRFPEAIRCMVSEDGENLGGVER